MNRRKFSSLVAVVGLLAMSACGGDSGSTDTSTQTDTPGTTDPGPLQDPGTPPDDPGKVDPGTSDPGKVDPGKPVGNPHTYWPGADWDTVWPEQGETAVYRAVLFGGDEKDVPAYMDYTPVDWKGGTWSRAVIGTPEPGNDGFIVYFDRSVPWNPTAKGVEVFSSNVADGPSMVEWFDPPATMNMDQPEGTSNTVPRDVHGEYGGFDDTMGANYKGTFVSYDASGDVPFGTVEGCMHIQIDLSGELIGAGSILIDVFLHPEQFLVKMTDTPGFALIELKEGWK